MAFAIIAGVTYDVVKDGATEAEPEKIGSRRRTFDGTMRSGERAEKRKWSFQLAPMLEATYQTFRAARALSVPVTCNGDFVGNVATSCIVDITSAVFFRPFLSSPMMRQVTIDVTEA